MQHFLTVITLALFLNISYSQSVGINFTGAAPNASGALDIDVWERARSAMAAIHITPSRIHAIIAQAGLPESPSALGWNEDYFWSLGNLARFTRDRFTCLDVG